MKEAGKSLKYIFGYMKKYWISLIFVLLFIIATTYFQVVSPRVMGEAIDGLSQYVISDITTDTKKELSENLINGDGLSDEQKQTIEDSVLPQETKDSYLKATPEELQAQAEQSTEMIRILDLNPLLSLTDINTFIEKTINAEELTDEQKDYIKDSSLTKEDQDLILANPDKLQAVMIQNIKTQLGLVDTDVQDQEVIDLANNILDGEGLSDDNKSLIESGDLADDEKKEIEDSEVQTIQFYLAMNINEIYGVDFSLTSDLTDEQIEEVNNSDVLNDQSKAILLMSTPEQIFQLNTQLDAFRYDEASVDEKHESFIDIVMKLVIVYLLLALTNFIYTYLMVQVSGKTTRAMRIGLFAKIEKLSIRFFDSNEDGDLLSRFVNDIDNISNALNQSITQSLSQVAMLFGIVYIMFDDDTSYYVFGNFTLDNVMTWSMILFAVGGVILALFVVRKAQYYVSRQQKRLGELNSYIDERVQGQSIVKIYDLEDETLENFEIYNERLRETSFKGQVYSGLLMPIINGIGSVNLAVLVFIGSIFVSQGVGGLTVGILVAFIQYSQRFFQPLAQIFSQYNLIELGLTGAVRIQEIHEVPADVVNSENAKPIDGIQGKVVLKDVTFGYNPSEPVLKDINIDVPKGHMVALVGPTGSGKTTVMNLLNRFYDIDSGDILYDGTSIKDITLETLRKNIGIVLQESVLFTGTIAENISYGRDDATHEEIIEAAKLANLHEYITELDEGYETIVHNSSSIFSTGQKQLMSIARTILTDPDLLILDEATSNVDTVTEEKIQKAMNNVINGRTSFVIAHRLKTILDADVIVVLKDGEIIEKGNHEELLAEDGFYAELYNNQFVTI